MVFLLLFFVCFLAQCAFRFADEHLLVLLITALMLTFFATTVSFLQSFLHDQRVAISSFVLKSRFLNLAFLAELEQVFEDLEETLSTVFIVNVEIFESLVPFISEYYDNLLLLELQNQVSFLLNQTITSIRADASEDQSAVLDLTLGDFDED